MCHTEGPDSMLRCGERPCVCRSVVGSVAGRCCAAASVQAVRMLRSCRSTVRCTAGRCFPHLRSLPCPGADTAGWRRLRWSGSVCVQMSICKTEKQQRSSRLCCPSLQAPAHRAVGLPAISPAVCGRAPAICRLVPALQWGHVSAKRYKMPG